MMNYAKSGCSKGNLPFPTTQGSRRMGVELDHSSSILKRWAQQRATELIFVRPSKPDSEECLSSWPSSSEPTSFRNTASPGLSLCSEADSGRRDAVWVRGSCWFFILWDVCSVAYLLFPLLSLLAPPWPHLKKTKGNWQAAGQGELSYMISPWGTLLCCLYLKAIIFYISWQEFSSTGDP